MNRQQLRFTYKTEEHCVKMKSVSLRKKLTALLSQLRFGNYSPVGSVNRAADRENRSYHGIVSARLQRVRVCILIIEPAGTASP